MEHEANRRVKVLRIDEIEELDANLAAVACPFCLTVLDECGAARNAQVFVALKECAEVVIDEEREVGKRLAAAVRKRLRTNSE